MIEGTRAKCTSTHEVGTLCRLSIWSLKGLWTSTKHEFGPCLGRDGEAAQVPEACYILILITWVGVN